MPRLTFFSSHSEKTHSASSWDAWDDCSLPGNPYNHLFYETKQPQSPDSHIWWLDVCDATDHDVDVVSQMLSIHPLTAEDIATNETREKVEVFRNYYLISFQTLLASPDGRIASPSISSSTPSSAGFYILVFQNGTVTFSPSGCGHVQRVRDRIRRMHDSVALSSDWICYALIDDIVDSFLPYMQAAERESESIEDQVFIARVDDVKSLIPRVDNLRKKITHLIRCLSGKSDVLNGFVKRCSAKDKHNNPNSNSNSNSNSNPAFFPDGHLILYLGDVQDHLVTTMSNLTHFDEIVGRSQANCLAQLSATNLRMSLTINEVMSKVTLLATIFVPLHLVTGLFGMNVEVPGQETKNLDWFFGIVGSFVAFMVVSCLVAWRYKLL